jgi:hypothetical protein
MATSISALTWMQANNPLRPVSAVTAKPHVKCRLETVAGVTSRGTFGETWSAWSINAASADASPGGSITYGPSIQILSTAPAVTARAQLRDCGNHRAPSNSIRQIQKYGGIFSCQSVRLTNRNAGTAAYVGWLRGHNSQPGFDGGNEAGVCFAAYPGEATWTCVVATFKPVVGYLITEFATAASVTVNTELKIVLRANGAGADFYVAGSLVFSTSENINKEVNKSSDATFTIREYALDKAGNSVAAPTLSATMRVSDPRIDMWRTGYMGTRLVHNNW